MLVEEIRRYTAPSTYNVQLFGIARTCLMHLSLFFDKHVGRSKVPLMLPPVRFPCTHHYPLNNDPFFLSIHTICTYMLQVAIL